MSLFFQANMAVDTIKDAEFLETGGFQAHKIDRLNQQLVYNFQDKTINVLIIFASDGKEMLAFIAYDLNERYIGEVDVSTDIEAALTSVGCDMHIWGMEIHEISAFDYNKLLDRVDTPSGFRELKKYRLGIEYTQSRYNWSGNYEVSDFLIPNKLKTKAVAKREIKNLMPDATFMKELERIYSKEHPKNLFYGFPCHYKLSVSSDLAADEMVQFLVDCLYNNNRILSRRITKIDKITSRISDEQTFEEMMHACQGSTVEIVLNGDVASEERYASDYHQVTDTLQKYIKKYAGEVLFVFVENTGHPGFAKQLLGKVDEEIDIIEIKEGVGNGVKAEKYFRNLLRTSNMTGFYEESDHIFEAKKCYSVSEVRTMFQKWRQERLRDRVYRAYNNEDIALKMQKEEKKKGSAYDELQSMIGLSEVKTIVDDIIAAYKIQKMRNEFYSAKQETTRHMIFCGNPGSAKTTIARLMTEVMKEEGILKTGAFIECGRVDLVGKYVGWTANIVKDKFKQASGGVLFIDEAYSLVDDSNTFGAEAINTIVQEMENGRGDVIVVFAGYPEKMKAFLEQNEGLRSRIAFHVNFPDYAPDELMGILEKMTSDKNYTLTEAAKNRAKEIFEKVYKNEEYGNGRFVRNLFEQAINRQASRIMKMDKKTVTKETLFELDAEDFETNLVKQYMKEKKAEIGFAC